MKKIVMYMKKFSWIILGFIVLSVISGTEISSTFFAGFFVIGYPLALMGSKKFNRKVLFDIATKGTLLGMILVFFITTEITCITFFIIFGMIIGYPYFCNPAQWHYDWLRYHKYY